MITLEQQLSDTVEVQRKMINQCLVLEDYDAMHKAEDLLMKAERQYKSVFGFEYSHRNEYLLNEELQKLKHQAVIELQRMSIGEFFWKGCVIHKTNNIRNGLSGCIQLVEDKDKYYFETNELYDLMKAALENAHKQKSEIVKQVYSKRLRYR